MNRASVHSQLRRDTLHLVKNTAQYKFELSLDGYIFTMVAAVIAEPLGWAIHQRMLEALYIDLGDPDE